MARPIPVEIIPSHIHLSETDHRTLFGPGHAGTIATALSQHGQYAYAETLEVFGKLKRGFGNPVAELGCIIKVRAPGNIPGDILLTGCHRVCWPVDRHIPRCHRTLPGFTAKATHITRQRCYR